VPLLRAQKPRHAKPSKTAPVIAAGGMTATLGAAFTASPAEAAPAQGVSTKAQAATANDFARLRQCESGGNYRINTGNGYYGAYQFDLRTWRGLGYSGRPHEASPGTQDAAARELQAQRGWQPWPACSRKLGLGRHEVRASRATKRSVPASRPAVRKSRPAVGVKKAPDFSGTTITTALVKQRRADVKAWQARMNARGWDLVVDGQFGKRSARVAARFAAEKGIKAKPGTVNAAMWKAAWERPIT
jgi:hypothetical protein